MPASQDYEEIDALTFAEWGVDYLKYDYCFAPPDVASAKRLYAKMGVALKVAGSATGRPIVFSICEWGSRRPWLWGREVGGHLWRSTGDIWNGWDNGPLAWNLGVDHIGFELQRGLEDFAGPGGWNDPDMMVVGLRGSDNTSGPGLTLTEQRTHFSLWCMSAAPLMVGCDIREMDTAIHQILTNAELIRIDQDPLGKQGFAVFKDSGWKVEVWKKPLQGGDLAVGLFNRSVQRKNLTAYWSDLDINGSYKVRDLWKHEDLGVYDTSFSADVDPHGCVILRLAPA
jgi:alpha-galactosidase